VNYGGALAGALFFLFDPDPFPDPDGPSRDLRSRGADSLSSRPSDLWRRSRRRSRKRVEGSV